MHDMNDPMTIALIVFVFLQQIFRLVLSRLFKSNNPTHIRFIPSIIAVLISLNFFHFEDILFLVYFVSHIFVPSIASINDFFPDKKKPHLDNAMILIYLPYLVILFILGLCVIYPLVLIRLIYSEAFNIGLVKRSLKLQKVVQQAKFLGIKLKFSSFDYISGIFNDFNIEIEEKNKNLMLTIYCYKDDEVDQEKYECALNQIKNSWKGKIESDLEEGYVTIYADLNNFSSALTCLKNAMSACSSSKASANKTKK